MEERESKHDHGVSLFDYEGTTVPAAWMPESMGPKGATEFPELAFEAIARPLAQSGKQIADRSGGRSVEQAAERSGGQAAGRAGAQGQVRPDGPESSQSPGLEAFFVRPGKVAEVEAESFKTFSKYQAERTAAVDGAPDDIGATGLRALNEQTLREISVAMAEERAKGEERGRKEGFSLGVSTGREESRAEMAAAWAGVHRSAQELEDAFANARANFFAQLELETGKLALAIAERVLGREAETDPLLLLHAVRRALGQLAASTRVKLRVSAEDQQLWEKGTALIPGVRSRLEVIGDGSLRRGACVVETELGTADLGLDAQLWTIQQGLLKGSTGRYEAQSAVRQSVALQPESKRSEIAQAEETQLEGTRPAVGNLRLDGEADSEGSRGLVALPLQPASGTLGGGLT